MAIVLRPATVDDAQAIGRLHEVCFGGPRAYVTPWTQDDFHEFLKYSNYHGSDPFIVAEKDGQIAGFIMAQFNADKPFKATVMTVDVDPTYRHEGIASLMLSTLEEHILTQRTFAIDTVVVAEINTANISSQKLFSAFSYAATAVRKDYYASGVDAVIVQKSMPARAHMPL